MQLWKKMFVSHSYTGPMLKFCDRGQRAGSDMWVSLLPTRHSLQEAFSQQAHVTAPRSLRVSSSSDVFFFLFLFATLLLSWIPSLFSLPDPVVIRGFCFLNWSGKLPSWHWDSIFRCHSERSWSITGCRESGTLRNRGAVVSPCGPAHRHFKNTEWSSVCQQWLHCSFLQHPGINMRGL